MRPCKKSVSPVHNLPSPLEPTQLCVPALFIPLYSALTSLIHLSLHIFVRKLLFLLHWPALILDIHPSYAMETKAYTFNSCLCHFLSFSPILLSPPWCSSASQIKVFLFFYFH